jgi:hypothetical protein
MSTYYYAETIDCEYLFGNFPTHLVPLIAYYKESQKLVDVEINGKTLPARIGRKENKFGRVYTLSTEERYINRYKLFKELVEMSLLALEPISTLLNNIRAENEAKSQDFIHNLISLNSYNIQALYALIPQSVLNGNINKQIDAVKDIVVSQPYVASKTLLKLIKYSLVTKIEFSVFERTLRPYQVAQKTEYPIRNTVLAILQIFLDDFDSMKITVGMDACDKQLSFDHDALIVSLYYLFDNAIKYCCQNTDFKIIFKEEPDAFSILFIMISARIEDSEVDKLTLRGYRSENVRQINKEGSGIGMYRILKTLKLNDAILEIVPRVNKFTKQVGSVKYEGNLFKIKFPGQQDWFRS